VISKRLTVNAGGEPVLQIRLTGTHDVYRFAFGMQTLQVEFARKGTLALRGLRRLVGTIGYGQLVNTFHGDGRENPFDRRGAYQRGYADAIVDKAELVALALHAGIDLEKIADLIPQQVYDDLFERGLLVAGRDFSGEGTTDTNAAGVAYLTRALREPTETEAAAA
jgi:hypothetical protein